MRTSVGEDAVFATDGHTETSNCLFTPSPPENMVVAVSCCREDFIQLGEGNLSRVDGKMNEAKWRKILEENLLDEQT